MAEVGISRGIGRLEGMVGNKIRDIVVSVKGIVVATGKIFFIANSPFTLSASSGIDNCLL